jgi:hypothetical protein
MPNVAISPELGERKMSAPEFVQAGRDVLSQRAHDADPTPDGTTWCYDPDESNKGTHAYPYVAQVWAYDAAALLTVRRGRRRPWQVKPYATWRLRLPYGSPRVGGAAYDPAARRLYVSQQYGDGSEPVIHVFAVR